MAREGLKEGPPRTVEHHLTLWRQKPTAERNGETGAGLSRPLEQTLTLTD